jgi:UDP-N-acetylmuramoylalanine--D-glutamate ligase
VLELSELQLPTISRGAEIAVYTNVGADHLDRHGSVEAYRAVKARLAELSVEEGEIVLNADDPGCRELGSRLSTAEVYWYGLDYPDVDTISSPTWVQDGQILVGGLPVMPAGDVPLPGRHLLADALAAITAGALVGVDRSRVAEAIRGFPGVPHRMEALGERAGVRYVNDSQATIPVAALAALDAFAGEGIVLVAGGKDKGLDYRELADAIAAGCRAAVLIGETADVLERLIGGRMPVRRAGSMDEAVGLAAGLARPGDVVLLSPAAASFDMFVDYAARGDAFRAAVAALPGGGA